MKDKTSVMPEYAPAYSYEFFCPEAHTVGITIEGAESEIKELLSYTPFEYITHRYQIWFADLKGHTVAEAGGGYKECGITVPVRFQNVVAGHSLYMYCSDVAAILAGREIFGIPKKFADIEFIETEIGVSAVVRRNGVELVKMGFCFSSPEIIQPEELLEVEKMNRQRIMLKVIPKAEESGAALRQVVLRDTARQVKSRRPGNAAVVLGELPSDPLKILGANRILGATFSLSSYGGGLKVETRKVLANLE